GFSALLLLTALASAEVASRVDDWIRLDLPVLATPDHQRDLTFQDEHCLRGRPGARFKKWKLNQFGFRAPEMSREPAPGRVRIMILGASDALGFSEPEGMEFPAQLARLLQPDQRYEVINVAIAGMTAKSMISYWESWVSRFSPNLVFVYASPLFYL